METETKEPNAILREVLTVPEVAALKGVHQTTVTRALEKGRLLGEQRHRFWLVAKVDADEWTPPRKKKESANGG